VKFIAIFLKELVDLLRDRRSLFSGFAYALAGPALAVFAVNMLALQAKELSSVDVATCDGAAPADLVEYLAPRGIGFVTSSPICLRVAPDFAERLAGGRTATIGIEADLAVYAAPVRRLESELQRFGSMLSAQRLLARGVSPSVTSPVSVSTHSTNAVSRQADAIARMLVIFFVSAPFFVGVAAAADLTAGERERRSLETLLANPVKGWSIVLGKWLAVCVVSLAGVILCVAAGLTLLARSSLPEIGVRLETDGPAIAMTCLMLVPLTMMVVALQITVGFWSKSFKDAQSYLMLLSFSPVVVGFALTGERLVHASQFPLAWELGALSVPLLNSNTHVAPFAVVAGIEALVGLALLGLSARRLRSEAVLAQA
jgi:sodium transport system permease protein